jgi:hypothetical protein
VVGVIVRSIRGRELGAMKVKANESRLIWGREQLRTCVNPRGQSRTNALRFVTGSAVAVYPGRTMPY